MTEQYPRPQYFTPRRPERPTLGTEARKTAEMLNVSLQPWQRAWLDVVGELVPDERTGELVPAYVNVQLSVGRRAGKTLATAVYMLTKMRLYPRTRCFWTAQNQQSATMSLTNEIFPLIERSTSFGECKLRNANGREAVELPNGSELRMFSPKKTSMHGQAADCIYLDEIWHLNKLLGADLDIALRPTMATRPMAQMITTSAAGDADGDYWLAALDTGRLAASQDTGDGLCHWEWTAEGTGLDTADPETWFQVHPGNVPTKWLRDEYQRNPVQFVRTYLNVSNRETGVQHCISVKQWELCAKTGNPPPIDSNVSIAFDCEPDSKSATIVACLGHADHVEVIESRDGVDWVPARIAELVAKYDTQPVAFDNRSPAGVLEARLDALGVPQRHIGLGDAANAAQSFADLVHAEQIGHRRHPALDAAVDGAQRRTLGDGGWAFSRKDSKKPVSPLIAASLAWYCHRDAHGTHEISIY